MSMATRSGTAALRTAGLFVVATLAGPARPLAEQKASPTPVPLERCSKALAEFYGEPAPDAARGSRAPKSLRTPRPRFPERKGGACNGSAMHEVLVDPAGKVRQLWVLREPNCTPPWPALGEAIRGAVRTWAYEPAATLHGKPIPACLVVTTHIHWR